MAMHAQTRRAFLKGSLSTGVVLIAGAALVACAGGSAPAVSTPAAPTAAPTTGAPATAAASKPSGEAKKVEFWGATGGQFADDLRKVLPRAQSEDGVQIDYIVVPGGWPGMTQKLNAAIGAKSVPDLAGIKDFSAKDYAWRGAVQKLDDFFKGASFDTTKFRKSVWDAVHYRGAAYGAPWPGSFVHVLFMNDDLFSKAGLDPAKPPAKWDDLVSVAKKLTDTGAGQWGHAFYELGTREYNLMLFSIYDGQSGGKVFTDDGSKVTLDTPTGNEAMQWMYDMLWTWKVTVPPEQMQSLDTLIKSGKVGTWNAGPWSIWDYRKNAPQLKWSITQWPGNKTNDNVDAPECLVILTGAKDPDSSWKATKFLLNPEFDLQLAGPRGALPVYEENLDKGIFKDDPAFKVYAQIGRGKDLRPRAYVDGYEDVASVITPHLQAVWFNQATVKDGLAAADKDGNDRQAQIRQHGP